MDCDGHTSDLDTQTNFLQGKYVKELTNETKKIAKGQTDEETLERISSYNLHDDDVIECNGHMCDSDFRNNFLQGKYVTDIKHETKGQNGEEMIERINSTTLHEVSMKKLIKRIYQWMINGPKIFILTTVMLTIANYWAWEHAGKIIILQNSLCSITNLEKITKIELEPWNEGNQNTNTERDLNDMFINITYYTNHKKFSDLLQVFTENTSKYAQRYLLVADQGFGKTTSVKMLHFKWCRSLHDANSFVRKIIYAKEAIVMQEFSDLSFYKKCIVNLTWLYLYALDMIVSIINTFFSWIPKYLPVKGLNLGILSGIKLELPVSSVPKLLFVYEFRNIINITTLSNTIMSQFPIEIQGISEGDLNLILRKEIHSTLLVLDGWDEYSRLKYSVGAAPEMEAIVYREERKNINILVTTRSWKSDDLLLIDRFGYTKLSLTHFTVPTDRDLYIHSFFPVGDEADALICVLNREESIVPKELQKQPRMLLYICNLWKYRYHLKNEEFRDKEKFWNELWEMMRLTFNRKYPHKIMSQGDVLHLRNTIGNYVKNFNDDDYISFDEFNKQFGDDHDLFYFGIFSTETFKDIPWKESTKSPVQKVKATNPSMMKAEKEIKNSKN
ncbi:unnamed protein product [Meganyctiphanes norvegica]|uniref:Uncharacterized protein n=1 Tax=Meganyctiphanes norvegica TaxID=48144 RepID=A0AAV2PRP5_MEGNR